MFDILQVKILCHKLKHLSANLDYATIGDSQASRSAKRKIEDATPNVGPRSVMRTTTDLLVATSVTRTIVPNGRLRWAAVGKSRSNDEPLAVFPVG